MNTIPRAITIGTGNTTGTATSTATAEFSTPTQPRLAALALSCVLTLGMLLGIHTLAATDSDRDSGPQMAQQAGPSHS